VAVAHGDIMRAVVNITLPNLVVANNVFYYQLEDELAEGPTDNAILNAMQGQLQAIYEEIKGAMVDEAEAVDVDVDVIEWDGDSWENVENLGNRAIGKVGVATADMSPHGVAALLTGTTQRPQTRGRKFWSGIAEDMFTDSDAGGSLLTFLLNTGIQWLTEKLIAGTSARLVPGVVGQSGGAAGTFLPLLTAVVGSLASYQRRRKPGVGS